MEKYNRVLAIRLEKLGQKHLENSKFLPEHWPSFNKKQANNEKAEEMYRKALNIKLRPMKIFI